MMVFERGLAAACCRPPAGPDEASLDGHQGPGGMIPSRHGRGFHADERDGELRRRGLPTGGPTLARPTRPGPTRAGPDRAGPGSIASPRRNPASWSPRSRTRRPGPTPAASRWPRRPRARSSRPCEGLLPAGSPAVAPTVVALLASTGRPKRRSADPGPAPGQRGGHSRPTRSAGRATLRADDHPAPSTAFPGLARASSSSPVKVTRGAGTPPRPTRCWSPARAPEPMRQRGGGGVASPGGSRIMAWSSRRNAMGSCRGPPGDRADAAGDRRAGRSRPRPGDRGRPGLGHP